MLIIIVSNDKIGSEQWKKVNLDQHKPSFDNQLENNRNADSTIGH